MVGNFRKCPLNDGVNLLPVHRQWSFGVTATGDCNFHRRSVKREVWRILSWRVGADTRQLGLTLSPRWRTPHFSAQVAFRPSRPADISTIRYFSRSRRSCALAVVKLNQDHNDWPFRRGAVFDQLHTAKKPSPEPSTISAAFLPTEMLYWTIFARVFLIYSFKFVSAFRSRSAIRSVAKLLRRVTWSVNTCQNHYRHAYEISTEIHYKSFMELRWLTKCSWFDVKQFMGRKFSKSRQNCSLK